MKLQVPNEISWANSHRIYEYVFPGVNVIRMTLSNSKKYPKNAEASQQTRFQRS